MTLARNIERYLHRHAEPDDRPFRSGSLQGIERVVVIPALAELDSLFATLASLSQNPPGDLSRTLVLCVINNRKPGRRDAADYRANQATLALLSALIDGDIDNVADPLRRDLQSIRGSRLRLASLDASSPGHELPDKGGGVGLARKIGMDKALRLLAGNDEVCRLICCLDADTKVATDYLPAVHKAFREGRRPAAATVAYAHEIPADAELAAAIVNYEIYLRYYVIGLQCAGSPYAFHTIGSTIVVEAGAYATVRGMNRLMAAEDFYFLNKLAKIGPIRRIDATRVYPAARMSQRVPFGTGRRMIRTIAGDCDGRLYDPRVFFILKLWLAAVMSEPNRSGKSLCLHASDIHPALFDFLHERDFPGAWDRIRSNSRSPSFLRRHFHCWFDGFVTLKLIHYLNDRSFPAVARDKALQQLPAMIAVECPLLFPQEGTPSESELLACLDYLRRVVP
jgi:hypothetical protein